MNTYIPSRTFSQIIWVSIGRICLVGTWFIATILIGRVLGVVGFGLYVYCQTAIKIVTGCVGDPLDMAVMRRAPLLLKNNRPAALQLIRSAFWLRVLIGTVVLLAIVAVPAFASRKFFGSPNYQLLVILTAAGVLGDFLLRSALGFFQIGEQFHKFMAVDSVWQGGARRCRACVGFAASPNATLGCRFVCDRSICRICCGIRSSAERCSPPRPAASVGDVRHPPLQQMDRRRHGDGGSVMNGWIFFSFNISAAITN